MQESGGLPWVWKVISPHPIKGNKMQHKLIFESCIGAQLWIFVVVLLYFLFMLTSCLRFKLPLEGSRFSSCSSFDLSTKEGVFHDDVQSTCLYNIYCLFVLCFCWCLHIAAPQRGHLFHLIEGQYLQEHSYRQLSCRDSGWTEDRLPLYLHKI